ERGHVADVHTRRAVIPEAHRTLVAGVLVAAHVLDEIFVADTRAAGSRCASGGSGRNLVDGNHPFGRAASRACRSPSADRRRGMGAKQRANDAVADVYP